MPNYKQAWEQIAYLIEPHWQGAGAEPGGAWLYEAIFQQARDEDAINDRIDEIDAENAFLKEQLAEQKQRALDELFGDLHGSFLVTAAVRYALGRKTAAPWCVTTAVKRVWAHILPAHQQLLADEIRDWLRRAGANEYTDDWCRFLAWVGEQDRQERMDNAENNQG